MSTTYDTSLLSIEFFLTPFLRQRPKLSDGYESFKSGKPAPLFTTDGVPLFLGMDAVRKIVKFDEAKSTASHDANLDFFWDSLVREVADGWNATDVRIITTITRYHH